MDESQFEKLLKILGWFAKETEELQNENKRLRSMMLKRVLNSALDAEEVQAEIERLRAAITQLHSACNDLVESAQGGKYGEIICDIDNFNALEKLLATDDEELGDE